MRNPEKSQTFQDYLNRMKNRNVMNDQMEMIFQRLVRELNGRVLTE